jgi:hypothetical protein
MRKTHKSKMVLMITVLLFINTAGLYSKDKQEETKGSSFNFHWSIGTKGVYSSGISDPYAYNKSNIKGEVRSDYVDVSAFIQRYFHYQLTDGNGIYEYRSFNEAGLSLTAHLFKIIDLTGEYNRADDFDDLKRDTYIGSIELDIFPVVLSADYSCEKSEYKMNSAAIDSTKRDYSFQFEYNVSDTFSADIGYSHSDSYYNIPDYTYYKNIIRAGLAGMPSEYIYLIGGVNLGKDSSDYNIYSADCGITIKPYSNIKLILAYNIAYYNPPAVGSSRKSSGSHGPGNPYLSEDKTGDPYYSHVVSLGLTLSF